MMTIPEINSAIEVACFPKELEEYIWVKERKPFEVY